GQVARRLWGAGHRFSALWPSDLKQAIQTPVPAKVAAGMGWNQISIQAQPKSVRFTAEELEALPPDEGEEVHVEEAHRPLLGMPEGEPQEDVYAELAAVEADADGAAHSLLSAAGSFA